MQRRVRVHCQFTAWQFSHLLWRPQRCEGLSFWTLTKLLVLTNDQLRKALLGHTDWDDKLSNQWFTFRRHVRLHQTHSGRRLCCAFMRTGQTDNLKPEWPECFAENQHDKHFCLWGEDIKWLHFSSEWVSLEQINQDVFLYQPEWIPSLWESGWVLLLDVIWVQLLCCLSSWWPVIHITARLILHLV